MRTFDLLRDEDVSGTSGTGRVAQGVEFDDGTVALRWLTEYKSTALYDSIVTCELIHGHDGRTRIVWPSEPRVGSFLRHIDEIAQAEAEPRGEPIPSSGQWCLIHNCHQDDPLHDYSQGCEGHHRDATAEEEWGLQHVPNDRLRRAAPPVKEDQPK